MAFAIALTDEQWELVADLFDPPGRRGAPARIPRRRMVEAMLFIPAPVVGGATCCERYGGLERGLGAVAALAGQRGLAAGDGEASGARAGAA
jgi:hypothetical protein